MSELFEPSNKERQQAEGEDTQDIHANTVHIPYSAPHFQKLVLPDFEFDSILPLAFHIAG